MQRNKIWDILESRHSVREFTDQPIEKRKIDLLQAKIDEINEKSGLHIVLKINEPVAFQAEKPHYGSFKNCRNYFALYAEKDEAEKVGYYGEELVLYAQEIGLNTCWVALTFKSGGLKNAVPGKKLYDVIALGYGQTQGKPHISKPVTKLAKVTIDTPQWFEAGMDAVMLAPSAVNQQRFFFEQIGERKVKAKLLWGFCTLVDLGIAKYHFEIGAGKENFEWE